MTQQGLIPHSEALAEATTDSLSELLSRDPFKFTTADRTRVIAALREQRAAWEKAEAEGKSAPKARKVAEAAKTLISSASADDLGL